MLKLLISSLLVGSSLHPIPDEDGWVSVERPDPRPFEEPDDAQKGIWVVFSKEIEGEKFLVRFPEDPSYRYLTGGIELNASSESGAYTLRVEKREGPQIQNRLDALRDTPGVLLLKEEKSSEGVDLFYWEEGKWVWERLQESSKFLYTFRTASPGMDSGSHRYFTSSLDLF